MKSLYTVILGLSLVFASCDNSTSTKKSSSSSTPTTKGKTEGGETSQAKTVYSFAFATKEHSVPHKVDGIYTQEVKEENPPEGDERTISYSSSEPKIATVDETTGTVTFKTAGTVTITASKEADGEHKPVSDTYTLYITMKPQPTTDADGNSDFGKAKLVKEIERAMTAHGPSVDLNYIDTSTITDMRRLFSSHKSSYGLSAFAGNISKWNVSRVTDMVAMFYGATAFNSDISQWDVSEVTTMTTMFLNATAFKQNLDAWGSKINDKIKERDWAGIHTAFTDSGLKDSLPDWCKNSICKDQQ